MQDGTFVKYSDPRFYLHRQHISKAAAGSLGAGITTTTRAG